MPRPPQVPRMREAPAVLRRYDLLGPIHWMAAAGLYVMVARPDCHAFTMFEKDWETLAWSPEGATTLGLLVRWGRVEHPHVRRADDPPLDVDRLRASLADGVNYAAPR